MDNRLEQIRRLTNLLFLSVTANVCLLALFIYWIVRDRPPIPYYELKPAQQQEQNTSVTLEMNNVQTLRLFRTFAKEQLLAKLSDSRLIDDGYSQRDLALACLIQYHHFDLMRALGEPIPDSQIRKLGYTKKQGGPPVQIVVYSGLTEPQYQRIISFANTEKWPLTSRGLFLNLRRSFTNKEPIEPTLADAFCLTPEFMAVEMLFTRSGTTVDRSDLFQALAEGSWDALSKFNEEQKALQDLSSTRRQKFLLSLVHAKSKTAAYLLLKTDFSFAVRKLDDNSVIKIIELLTDKTPEAEKFSLALFKSPRGESVRKVAAQKLQDYNVEIAHIEPLVKKQNLLPLPAHPPAKKNLAIPPPKRQLPCKTIRYYVVKEGDSIWKIANLYKANVDDIRKTNQLKSDYLKPGLTLKIPVNPGISP